MDGGTAAASKDAHGLALSGPVSSGLSLSLPSAVSRLALLLKRRPPAGGVWGELGRRAGGGARRPWGRAG